MKKQIFTLVLGAALVMTGCSDFEELNVNPNNPSTVPANLLLPGIISTAVSAMTGSGNDAAGQFVQHINYLGGNNESFGRYNITGASFREQWNGPMRSVKDINQLLSLAEQNNQPHYKAIGLICKVYVLSLMTDTYGDIPYVEAGRANENGLEFPHFQSQEEVYGLMLEDLEAANVLIKNIGAGAVVSNDILYNGDLGKWRKFANSLKVRILMRESAKKDVSAQVAAIFNDPSDYPVFASSDDQATLVYNNTVDFYNWYIQPKNLPSDGSGVIFGDNLRVSEALADSLKSKNDPRLTVFLAPTKSSFTAHQQSASSPLVYRGQPVGLSTTEQELLNKDNYSVIGSAIRSESRAFVMSYSELLLLKSEAIVRNMIQGNAADEFRRALDASLSKWSQISSADKATFLAGSAASLSASTSVALMQIGTQAWIDSFLNGFEAFANWRRTGYPHLYVGPSVASIIPVRYIYSDNEQNNPNLIEWTNEKYGRMVNESDMVWFQPQVWPTPSKNTMN
ncbi:SusD/RagB family nutrient-binding outer membrane lipoprotein [uncultured Bacteroides sp.]|uniref:SusD/RagB family nutrient-binding outer membrane lipoprotein n=1 Tax=uncultured Bacteroides sp. TaxID=162156 RepID=UPI002AA902FF|nr:SusD/RagB family nutrient-binding outer membrane lipoprotein [uncultured Bacteroides sp.]